jgi:hypothetical protein
MFPDELRVLLGCLFLCLTHEILFAVAPKIGFVG